MRDVLVKFGVFLVADLRRLFHPDRFLGIERLGDGLFFVLLIRAFNGNALLDVHPDGILDEVGVLFDNAADTVFLEIFNAIILEGEDDVGSAFGPFGRIDGKGPLTGGFPAEGLSGPCLAGNNRNTARDHEGRIKTDPELSDQTGRILVILEGFNEIPSTGTGDCPEVLDELVFVHSDTVIGDGQSLFRLVHTDPDGKIIALGCQGLV
ncbi:MAG: hypothetical protein BWY82_02954 [Verrucomicrobia bacterium ADurb.Bin474]|nr:MAG: hypothetical protein BWY82_02954 [Verrucomicrobia bacterium ADurb.Bin474]